MRVINFIAWIVCVIADFRNDLISLEAAEPTNMIQGFGPLVSDGLCRGLHLRADALLDKLAHRTLKVLGWQIGVE
jgi:hypothetical protein